MDEKLIDVHFEDVNKKYYTIDEVANILSVEQSTIIYYFEKLNDFLNITSVGMYQLFDDTDVKNLKVINNLELKDNMSMNQIRKFLNQNKQEVLLEKEANNQLDKSVLNIFQKFANAIMEQSLKIDEIHNTNIKLVEFINTLSQNQEDIKQELQEQKEINQEILKEYKDTSSKQFSQINTIEKELSDTKEENKKLSQKLDKQEKNTQTNFNNISKKIDEDITLVKDLREKYENGKIKVQEKEIEELRKQLEEKNKGLFSKWFGKKQ